MRLNLACGCEYRQGWVNHDHPDVQTEYPVERRWDLNVFPWKCFRDAEFDEVEASHILEHLDHIVPVMRELARIVRPGGTLIIKVPHCSRTWVHPMHKTAFHLNFYVPLYGEGWIPEDFELVSRRLCWSMQRMYASKFGKLMASVGNPPINLLANLNQMACERLWANWVGGFDEIEFVFRRKG